MPSALHVSLEVSDLDRSIAFYRSLFGEPTKIKPGYAKFVGKDPELHLALGERAGAGVEPGRLSHLGIRVGSTQEVLRWKRLLSERGLPSRDEMQSACCYALQDKIWVEDPDGVRWEIYSVLEDLETEPAAMASGACCATAEGGNCC